MRQRVRVRSDVSAEPSLTRQSSKAECDLNLIIRRHGIVPPNPSAAQGFVDVSMVGDYFDCVQTVARAQQAFDALPAKVRKRFDNDPSIMLMSVDAAVGDPKGHAALVEELVQLDLLAPAVLERIRPPAQPGEPASPAPARDPGDSPA